MRSITNDIIDQPIGSTIHIFEAAGLGKAPFTYVGYYVKSGSCDYCGTAIINNFSVQSSDNKIFKVGCDCIEKSGDSGLKKVVCSIKSKIAKQKRELKKVKDKENFDQLLISHEVFLKSLPHPYSWATNKNRLDYFKYIGYKHGSTMLVKLLNESGVK
jgi:hypothetical protein